ncbi:hypothetical protein [Mesorhizobium sp. CN2-181]|uniref:hypothetical protein n=1 Tax=Mesorhizobium yinganensis TaxID=3157707 RepID=UPI0032B71213
MDLAMEDYQQALRRIAVLLIALAGLAERVAGRSRPLRGLVIWLLRPAEAAAREFVSEELAGAPMPPAPIMVRRGGDSPAEAIRLALCLRALASALDDISARAGRLAARLDPHRTARAAVSGAAPYPGGSQGSRSRQTSNCNPGEHRDPSRQPSAQPDTS